MKNKTYGIYLITEKATGRMYVGLAGAKRGIKERWRDHKKRFPGELFSYEILHPCPPGTTTEELSLLEKFYIRELDCMEPNGFNRTSGGCGSTEVSAESRKRRSEALKGKNKGRPSHNKGKTASEETKKRQSEAMMGRKKGSMSEEQKLKISVTLSGHTQSEESKRKKSETMKGRPSHNKGKTLSEETKKKIAEARRRQAAAKAAAISEAEVLSQELQGLRRTLELEALGDRLGG
jgi:hypothetical protein